MAMNNIQKDLKEMAWRKNYDKPIIYLVNPIRLTEAYIRLYASPYQHNGGQI